MGPIKPNRPEKYTNRLENAPTSLKPKFPMLLLFKMDSTSKSLHSIFAVAYLATGSSFSTVILNEYCNALGFLFFIQASVSNIYTQFIATLTGINGK